MVFICLFIFVVCNLKGNRIRTELTNVLNYVNGTSMEILPQSPTYKTRVTRNDCEVVNHKMQSQALNVFHCKADASIIDRTRIGSHPV